MIGQVVGNYKIIRSLGEGGVGRVYQGIDTMLDREVAIKVLRPEVARQTSIVERFRSEAVTLAKLNHPNIATLYSLLRQGDELFMVLEFVRGETLDQLLHRRGALLEDDAIPIFCQALDGINHAHELGIVHRDIKPGNMILTTNGILKVLDFGIARLLGTSRMTRTGNVIGTLEYMSPEQVRGQETDARSDIYGLGIMLYEMLTGRLPFESENDFLLMKAQTEEIPALPRTINPNISESVEAAIMKALAKNPDERFQSAGEFLDSLYEAGFTPGAVTFGFQSLLKARISRPSNPGLPKIENNDAMQKNEEQSSEDLLPSIAAPETEETVIRREAITEENNKIQTEDADALLEIETEIKETRLSADSSLVTPFNKAEFDEAEFNALETSEINYSKKENSAFFFDRLTWIHYAGAAAAVCLLFFGTILAAVLPFLFVRSQAVSEEPVRIEKTVLEETEPKPVAVQTPVAIEPTKPEPTPFTQATAQNEPEQPEQQPVIGEPIATPIVGEPPTVASPVAKQPEKPRKPESRKVEAPARKQSAPKQPGKSREQTLREIEQRLRDN
ncbi:MAG: protein kinase [Acidobacteriota bacterium]|nr:protein kinase [Acidobacteriota bacterium]